MPRKSDSAKPYYTLREAFDLVGKKVCGREWQGYEADCDPARAKQQTDARSLLRKLAPGGASFSTKEEDRQPVPKRPIDGMHHVRFGRAIGRHTKALKELLRFLHGGVLPNKFIPEDETTKKDFSTASKWPNPAEFDPKNPTWNNLWFDIAADRVVLKSPGTSPVPSRAHREGSLWWAYGGQAGHVEIDREALDRALRPAEEPEEADAPSPSPLREKATKPARRGRKKGSGSFAAKDAPLLEEMKPLIAKDVSHWAAAMTVVGKAAGHGNDQSKAKRLVARFKELEKNNSV